MPFILLILMCGTIRVFSTMALLGSNLQVLGGGGCSAEESSVPAILLVSSVLLYCYGTNFYLSYLPIIRGEHRFSWKMFV